MATGSTATYLLPYPLLTDAVDVHGDIQDLATQLESVLTAKAPLANPTFTGSVTLPSTTAIGTVSSTELGYLDGVTSAIQTQITARATLTSPTFTAGTTVTIPILSVTSHPRYAVAAVTTPITGATYTVATTDVYVIYNSASAISVTMPTASSFTGRVLEFKTTSTGAVTSAASNIIPLAGGAAAATIFSANTAGKWTTLVSNGTNWVIMAQN